jgi:hypothetical protein
LSGKSARKDGAQPYVPQETVILLLLGIENRKNLWRGGLTQRLQAAVRSP